MAEDGGRLRDRIHRIAGWQRAAGWRGVAGVVLASSFAVVAMADEHPGPLRPLAFVSLLDAVGTDRMKAGAVWADTGSFATARRFRVRGRYRVSGCDQAVVVAETLGTPSPEPGADRVKLVPCGAGSFELDFAAPDHAPGGLAVVLMNARGACGLVGIALGPPGQEYRMPDRRVRDVCWRSGKQVSPGYKDLAWVGEPGSQPLPVLPLQAGAARASDSLAEGRTALVFDNESPGVVFLHWMDFRGRPRLYGFLSPGESFRAWTTRDHAWTVASADGKPLGSARAGLQPGRVVIR